MEITPELPRLVRVEATVVGMTSCELVATAAAAVTGAAVEVATGSS